MWFFFYFLPHLYNFLSQDFLDLLLDLNKIDKNCFRLNILIFDKNFNEFNKSNNVLYVYIITPINIICQQKLIDIIRQTVIAVAIPTASASSEATNINLVFFIFTTPV